MNSNAQITDVDISEETLTVKDILFWDKDEEIVDRIIIYNDRVYVRAD